MEKKKVIQILLIVCLVLTVVFGGCARSEPSAPSSTPAPPEEPVPEPIPEEPIPKPTPEDAAPESIESILDSDGDGFSDWFEKNIAHYDPNVPNDRYFILYYRILDDREYDPEGSMENRNVHLPAKFLIEKGKVPPENIIKLTQEKATTSALKNAIEQVAEKSDKNDLVYIQINAHGSGTYSTSLNVRFLADEWLKYTTFNEWLDQIEAKVVILSISSCGCEKAVPILKEGPCPRTIYLYAGGWFLHMFGLNLDSSKKITTYYGSDLYISIGEVADCLDDQRVYGSDWNIIRERRNVKRMMYTDTSYIEVESSLYPYSGMVDSSNIAYETYLTDYKIPS